MIPLIQAVPRLLKILKYLLKVVLVDWGTLKIKIVWSLEWTFGVNVVRKCIQELLQVLDSFYRN